MIISITIGYFQVGTNIGKSTEPGKGIEPEGSKIDETADKEIHTANEGPNSLETNNMKSNDTKKIVTGRFFDTKEDPVVNYTVKILQSVSGPDTLLEDTITKENGSFFVNITMNFEDLSRVYISLEKEDKENPKLYSGSYYKSQINLSQDKTDIGDIHIDLTTSPLPSNGNSIKISGTWKYEDDSGDLNPIRRAEGAVYHDGWLWDSKLSGFDTWNNGYFETDIEDGNYDIFVRVKTYS